MLLIGHQLSEEVMTASSSHFPMGYKEKLVTPSSLTSSSALVGRRPFTMTSGRTAPSHAEQSRVVPSVFSSGFTPRWSLVFPGTQDAGAGVLAHVAIGNSH